MQPSIKGGVFQGCKSMDGVSQLILNLYFDDLPVLYIFICVFLILWNYIIITKFNIEWTLENI